VREKLNSAHLEQALSLLLDLYRNIRYSVSPRFELETVISKLCWLDRWVSPLELRDAVSGAVTVLGGAGGGIARPLAVPEPKEAPEYRDNPFVESRDFDQPGSLAEEFKRQMAVREAAAAQSSVAAEEAEVQPEQPAPAELHRSEASPHDSPPEELREKTIRGLSQVRGILASGLEKSLPWRWEEETLVIPMRDSLTAQLLKNDAILIRQVLADLWGSPLRFEVIEEARETPPEGVSPEAELVLRMFRGTVVENSKKNMEIDNEY
jgi:DNA polymerase-3 subunit gamma/tau